MELPPQQLIDYATRLPAYTGVVAARARIEAEEGQPVSANGARQVDASVEGIGSDPGLAHYFEFGNG